MPRLLALALVFAAAPALAQTEDLEPPPAPEIDRLEFDSAALAAAEAPASFTFQGVLSDGGQSVPDGTYSVQVRLFDVATSGTALYVEDHTVTTSGGVFSLSIGAGTQVSGAFGDVSFAVPTWVETVVAGSTLAPRTLLEAVPHARSLSAGAEVVGDVPGLAALVVRNTTPTGVYSGIYGETASEGGIGIYGRALATSGFSDGVAGFTASDVGSGVSGVATSPTGATFGVYGQSPSPSGAGVYGRSVASTGAGYGVTGRASSDGGSGVAGFATSSTGITAGVYGQSASTSGYGVFAQATASSGTTFGVVGEVASSAGYSGLFVGGRGIRVRTPGFIAVNDAARDNDDLLVEDSDAVVGIYSSAGATWGSAIALGEVDGGGALTNKWAIARRTGASGGLFFTFGTDYRYGINNALMRIDTDGSVHADGSFTGGGADLAEYFPLAPAASVVPGDLVGLRGGAVSLDTEGAEQVMIASSDPAFVGNPDAEAGGALVALVGQAEVRVSGPASVGDLLVASGHDDGTARAVPPARYAPEADGPVAGRVLALPEAGRALALVGVDEAAALRAVVARQQATLDAQAAEVRSLRDALGAQQAQIDALLARLGAPAPAVAAREP